MLEKIVVVSTMDASVGIGVVELAAVTTVVEVASIVIVLGLLVVAATVEAAIDFAFVG